MAGGVATCSVVNGTVGVILASGAICICGVLGIIVVACSVADVRVGAGAGAGAGAGVGAGGTASGSLAR